MRRNIHIRATCSTFCFFFFSFFGFIFAFLFFCFFHFLWAGCLFSCMLHAISVWNKDCHTQGRHILVIQQTFSKHALEWIPRNENYQNQRENISSHNHCERGRKRASERTREINLASRDILIRCFCLCARIFNLARPAIRGELRKLLDSIRMCSVWLAKQENRRKESEQRTQSRRVGVARTLPHWLYLRFYFIIKEYKTDDQKKRKRKIVHNENSLAKRNQRWKNIVYYTLADKRKHLVYVSRRVYDEVHV